MHVNLMPIISSNFPFICQIMLVMLDQIPCYLNDHFDLFDLVVLQTQICSYQFLRQYRNHRPKYHQPLTHFLNNLSYLWNLYQIR